MIWIVVVRERLPPSSVGLRRPDWKTLASAAVLWAIAMCVLPLIPLPQTSAMHAGVQRLAQLPLWFRLIVAASGGMIEEFFYRGYAIERLTTLTRSRWLAGVISIAAFVLGHIPQWGAGYALTADLTFGAVLTLFYLWRRDLVANMLAHSCALMTAMITIAGGSQR